MKKNIAILILMIWCFPVFAQQVSNSWTASFPGNGIWGDDRGMDIVLDNAGNVYSVGMFQGFTDFDPGSELFGLSTINDNYDIYVSKLDASGQFVRAFQI